MKSSNTLQTTAQSRILFNIPICSTMRFFKTIFTTSLGCVIATTIGAFLGFFLWSAYQVFVYDQVQLYAEHELLENTQAIVVAAAVLAFLAPAVFENRQDKLILLFCALLCYSFVLRELDVKRLDIHPTLILLGSGSGKRVTLTAAFIAIAVYAGFRFSYYKKKALRFLGSWSGILLMTGGIFLFVGDFFEKTAFIIHHVFFEEISELFGYVCILLSAFTMNSGMGHQAKEADSEVSM